MTEATVWDNQQLRPFAKVATFDHGRLVGPARWLEWTPAPLRALGVSGVDAAISGGR